MINWRLSRMILPVTGAMLLAFSASLYSQVAPPGAPPGPPPGAATVAPPAAPVGESVGESVVEPEVSPEHADAGFDTYANVGMLSAAWRRMDATLVADVALRFAEGERILLRPHKAITTGQVFDLAIRLATEKRDKATLTRLAKALEKSGDRARLEQVNLSMKVAGTARASDPTLQEGTAEELELIRKFQFQIEAARIDGSGETLKQLESGLADAPLKDKQRAALKKLIQEARDTQPAKEEAEVLELMSKVGGASRAATRSWYDAQPDVYGTIRLGKNGKYYRENFWFWRDRIFVVDKAHKGWFGEFVIDSGHMVMRQSPEYVRVLWNPPTGTRQLKNGGWVYVHPTDPNTVYFWQSNGTWSTNVSLTGLLEGGNVSGNSLTVSLPANIVAAGGGNIVAAGGGNFTSNGATLPAGIVAAGGGNIVAAGGGNVAPPNNTLVPRNSSPVIFTNNSFVDLPK